MRLYPKKLRHINDLERERKLLQKEIKRMEEDNALSMGGIFGGKGIGDIDAASLLDMLPVSNPIVTLLIKLVRGKIAAKKNNPKTEPGLAEKKSKSRIKSLAIEVIGGYLKWKAIELSYKGIRQLVKKNKEKKNPQ